MQGSLRAAGANRHRRSGPPRLWASTPRRCWVDRPASVSSVPVPLPPWPPSRSSRCRPSPSAGAGDVASTPGVRPACRPSSGPCRPDRCTRPGPVSPSRRSNGSWATVTWCTVRTSSFRRPGTRRPGGHRARPDRGALPRALRSAHPAAYPALVRRAVAEGAWVHTPSQFVADQVVAELGGRSGPGPGGAPRHPRPRTPSARSTRTTLVLPEGCRRYVLGHRDRRAPQGLSAPGVGLRRGGRRPSGRGPGGGGRATAGGPSVSPPPSSVAGPGPDRATGLPRRPVPGRRAGRASVLAYPSLYEGFGFPPLQAMAAGVPGGGHRGRGHTRSGGDGALWSTPGDGDATGRGALARLLDGGPEVADTGGAGAAAERNLQLGGVRRGAWPGLYPMPRWPQRPASRPMGPRRRIGR